MRFAFRSHILDLGVSRRRLTSRHNVRVRKTFFSIRKNNKKESLILLVAIVGAALRSADGQVGQINPTGVAGMFNGNITTGCSYDPFTGNAMRTVTDLVVAGGVGSYPLAFTRIANSRQLISGQYQFGAPGAWLHSYSWSVGQSAASQSQQPPGYEVFFPDGRVETFTSTGSRGATGLPEHMQPLDLGTMLTYLVLPDGGKVKFQATQHSQSGLYWYTYRALAIIDPYGLSTTFNYNGDGSLNTIVEPAGRWIQIIYVTTPWLNGLGQHDRVIDHIRASDGRTVQYNYGYQTWSPGTMIYTYLGNVVYYGDSSMTAVYTYQAPNMPTGGNYNGAPLLASCRDPM